ncbi:hypothetical protein [Saccharothrix syringae]|uniref:NYN domain-containing protein n=1 Tax=Saccharothrix syringae TaxID=103733 RepID=A0A5Q0GZY0_SACSY|nr:hypothetical protein [Saccharothrix syringae]QFZ19518.1 hypothetical protein EKG83_20635 [Saccharothrix syringae]
MRAADRVLLIDVGNVVGVAEPCPLAVGPDLVRARVGAVLRAAGPVHHVMACYASAERGMDLLGSVLAEMGVCSRTVPPGRGAVEDALLAHARYAHGRGCRTFAVAAGEGFTAPHELGRFEVVRRRTVVPGSLLAVLAFGIGVAIGHALTGWVVRAVVKSLRGNDSEGRSRWGGPRR